MKRKFLLLCLILIARTYSFSQNTVVITSEELRTANLIFLEHKQLKETIPLLELRINNLELINNSWQKRDSINQSIITADRKTIEDKDKAIERLNKSIDNRNKVIKFGIIGICLSLLLVTLN